MFFEHLLTIFSFCTETHKTGIDGPTIKKRVWGYLFPFSLVSCQTHMKKALEKHAWPLIHVILFFSLFCLLHVTYSAIIKMLALCRESPGKGINTSFFFHITHYHKFSSKNKVLNSNFLWIKNPGKGCFCPWHSLLQVVTQVSTSAVILEEAFGGSVP
jgi:hypothetical protein